MQNTVTFLPPHQFFRLKFERRDGSAQRDGIIRITSKEGVPVTVYYRLRFGISGDRLPDARRMVDEGWNGWIRRARRRGRVGGDAADPDRGSAVAELLIQLAARSAAAHGRQPSRAQRIESHRVRSGAIRSRQRRAAPRETRRAAARRAQHRRRAWPSSPSTAPIGSCSTSSPTTAAFRTSKRWPPAASTGSLQTIQPTVSPMVWTTVATGLTPDRHGVIDFMDRSAPRAGRRLLAPRARASGTSPTRSDGTRSSRTGGRRGLPTAPNSIFYDVPVEQSATADLSAELSDRVASLAVPPDTVGYQQVRRFLNITPAEWDSAVNANNPADPIVIFRRILAKTWNDHRVAINLYNDQQQHGQEPTLTMISYEGTDAVNHLFAPFHPPYRDGDQRTELPQVLAGRGELLRRGRPADRRVDGRAAARHHRHDRVVVRLPLGQEPAAQHAQRRRGAFRSPQSRHLHRLRSARRAEPRRAFDVGLRHHARRSSRSSACRSRWRCRATPPTGRSATSRRSPRCAWSATESSSAASRPRLRRASRRRATRRSCRPSVISTIRRATSRRCSRTSRIPRNAPRRRSRRSAGDSTRTTTTSASSFGRRGR